VYTCLNGVTLAQHSEALWHLGWIVCLSVCASMWWMRSQLLVTQRIPLCAPSTRASLFELRSLYSGITVQIRINAHRNQLCLRGRPRRSFWSVCTHRICPPSFCLSLFLFLSLSRTQTHTLTSTHAAPHWHPLSHAHSLVFSSTHSVPHKHMYIHTNTFTHTHTHAHTHSRW